MEQRRVRLGDILDDYCPRERRITNHAVVAMVEDQVKQTRCTTCDADHEYKQAKAPALRRKKSDVPADSGEAAPRPRVDGNGAGDMTDGDAELADAANPGEAPAPTEGAEGDAEPLAASSDDDGPVHRRLIRATLPRPEGQMPERKAPDFTIHQPGRGGRGFDRNGRGGRQRMQGGGSQPPRFGAGGSGPGPGGSRPGSGQGGQRPPGNRPPGGPRGDRPGGGGRGGRRRGR